MSFWIVFASSGAFVVYDHGVEFFAMFVDELLVASCILPSDGFAGASSKGRGTSCPYSMKKG